jgi:hypothetical protein
MLNVIAVNTNNFFYSGAERHLLLSVRTFDFSLCY